MQGQLRTLQGGGEGQAGIKTLEKFTPLGHVGQAILVLRSLVLHLSHFSNLYILIYKVAGRRPNLSNMAADWILS